MAHKEHTKTKALQSLADGTVKQQNMLTGTQVWTVPGRGHRPLSVPVPQVQPISEADHETYCAFCSGRYEETPPEKSRIVRDDDGSFYRIDRIGAPHLHDQVAEFRRIPNLFEIVSYTYWHLNHGHHPSPEQRQHMAEYLSTPQGYDHVMSVVAARLRAMGFTQQQFDELSDDEKLAHANGFFSGGHDVIVARRHFTDGATRSNELASSGTLTPDEHEQYVKFTINAMQDLYHLNDHVRYVVAFQNWLKPAGASFDHLHKQLVAIDEHSVQVDAALERLHRNPHIYRNIMAIIVERDLVLAENDHAVAIAGFGHRYPSIEVWVKGPCTRPWEATDAQVRDVSDLLHAMHAATGSEVPCNEEWYHCPVDVHSMPMRWRILLKWRVSTLAGFEGGTRIYLNTISPWNLRDRMLDKLIELRQQGSIADMRIGDECQIDPEEFDH